MGMDIGIPTDLVKFTDDELVRILLIVLVNQSELKRPARRRWASNLALWMWFERTLLCLK